MEKGEEIIILKITKKAFEELYNQSLIDLKSGEFEIKEVEIFQESYPDDKNWIRFKEASIKAFKELKEYEFKLRHENKAGNNNSIE